MKKVIEQFERMCEKQYFPLILALIAFSFLSVFSWSTSPFFTHDGMDSAVFKTMGQALLKGKVLYRDIFDHKGPYLYFINALGQWLIHGRTGIFLLQVISLSIALCYMFNTAKLFIKPFLSLICLLLALIFFGGHIQEGNQCEEWMMYTICISFYYVCFYFAKKSSYDHPLHYSFIYGLCFGFSFFIRPNDAVAWFGGIMMGVALWLLYQKKYRNAILNTLCFLSGFIVMAIPVLIYFGYYNAIPDMWYGLVGFNQEYSGGILNLIQSCFEKNKPFLILIYAIFIWLIYDTGYEKLLFVITPAYGAAVLLMGTAMFLHYSICFVPFCLLFLTFFFLKSQKTYWTIAVFCILLHFSAYYKGQFAVSPSVMKWNRTGQQAVYKQAKHLFAHIPESEKDSIWNYGLCWEGHNGGGGLQSEFSVFCHSEIVPCNKITIGKNERLESEDMISTHRPKWILLQPTQPTGWFNRKTFPADSLFIASHYDVIAQSDTTICKLTLYKRR